MKLHFHVLALALAVGPATMAHAQYAPQSPNAQQDRDRAQPDRDDQPRQDRDSRGDSGSLRNLQDSIHQALPNSNVSAMMQDQNTIVLTGAVASQRERQEAEEIARQQAPNVRVIDQITVGSNGSYPGQYGTTDRDRDNGNYGNTDRDQDNRGNTGYATGDRDNDNRRVGDRDDQNQVRSDNDRQQSDRDRDNDRNGKKHKDKDKKDKDKKDKDKKDRDNRDNDDRQPH